MKQFIYIALIIIIIVFGLVIWGNNSAPDAPQEASTTTTSGTITSINTDQIAFDGPYVVTILTASGPRDIHIPSMGFPLCKARDEIEDISNLRVGQIIEVSGALSQENTIVSCESATHYLRVK